MGCGGSKKVEARLPGVLLLGSAGVGKSTIFKQVQLAYGEGISEQKRLSTVPVVLDRYIMALMGILQVAAETDIPLSEEAFALGEELPKFRQEVSANVVKEEFEEETDESMLERWTPERIQRIKGWAELVWAQEGAKRAATVAMYETDNNVNVEPCDAYLLDRIQDFCTPGYVPSDTDMIEIRRSTSGISAITINNYNDADAPVRLVDVGGQMHERHNWMEEAKNALVIIFILSLADYDEKTKTTMNTNTNRLRDDSVETLMHMIRHDQLMKTPVIIVFNKMDVFATKIASGHSVAEHYDPEYSGAATDVESSQQFIVESVVNKVKEKRGDEVTYYVTCAKDAEMAKKVFGKAVKYVNRANAKQSLAL